MSEHSTIEAAEAVQPRDLIDVLAGPAEPASKPVPPNFRPLTSVEVVWDLAHLT